MIAGVMIVALLVRSMDAIRYFDIITNTTNGGPADATKIVPIRLYETAFRFFDLGYAAAIGLSMLGGLDHHREPVPAHAQAAGAGAMKAAGADRLAGRCWASSCCGRSCRCCGC